MPYRSTPAGPHAQPRGAPEGGIVDDMVRQFADRHAFLRELVQNGIDAGATRIDVRLERSPDGAVRTTVDDDGCGMTRAIIEGPLLTLFESSKESDTSKIGKYGIGFVSVFAINPERVAVRTRRAGEAWLVRLYGDHSFELVVDAPRPDAGTGTEVTLHHVMDAEAFAVHVAQARTALVRWCRHAHLPITFLALDGYDGGDTTVVNAPLTLPGVVSVSITEGDERFVVAAGPAGAVAAALGPLPVEHEPSFSGFYGRGLTLMETGEAEPGLEGIRFKIDSPRLSHTLSRDSVRRDDQSRRLVARVHDLARDALWRKLETHVAEAAFEASAGTPERYAALFHAALVPAFRGRLGALRAPLVDAVAGERTMTIADVKRRAVPAADEVLVADASSRLTRALAALGFPVIRHVALAPPLRGVLGERGLLGAERAVGYVEGIGQTAEDEVMGAELARLLRAVGRRVARTRVAAFEGLAHDSSCRIVDTAEESALTAPADVMVRAWGSSSTLFLNAEHTTVRLARRRAKTDPAVAAQLVCRAILVAEGPLEPKVVDRLLHAASSDEAPAARSSDG